MVINSFLPWNTSSDILNSRLGLWQHQLKNTVKDLSTGYRINLPSDDPSGYVISTNFMTQSAGYDAASSILQYASNFTAVANNAISKIVGILQQMRELAISASSNLIDLQERENIQSEIDQLNSEINSIGENTIFNNQPVFPSNLLRKTPDIVQSTSFSPNNPSSDPILTLPSLPTQNNLLIAVVNYGNKYLTGGPTPTVTAPSGWVNIASADNNTDVGSDVYYRIVEHNDPQTYAFSIAPQDYESAAILELTNVDSSNPIDGIAQTFGGLGVRTGPSITATKSGDVPVATFETKSATSLSSTGTQWTTIEDAVQPIDALLVDVGPSLSAGQTINDSLSATGPAALYGYDSLILLTSGPASGKTYEVPRGPTNDDVLRFNVPLVTATQLGTANIDASTSTSASTGITSIDGAIALLEQYQGGLGTASDQMQNAISNNTTSSINLVESSSTIRDANYITLSTEYQREIILQNITTTLLAKSIDVSYELLRLIHL